MELVDSTTISAHSLLGNNLENSFLISMDMEAEHVRPCYLYFKGENEDDGGRKQPVALSLKCIAALDVGT